jgi:hypothetical protein
MPMKMVPVDVHMAPHDMDRAPVMVVVMMVPIVSTPIRSRPPITPWNDNRASVARTTVRTAPVSGIVMPPAGYAVHSVNHGQVIGGGLHAGRRTERHRSGALNERTRRQHRGSCRDAQQHFAHLCTSYVHVALCAATICQRCRRFDGRRVQSEFTSAAATRRSRGCRLRSRKTRRRAAQKRPSGSCRLRLGEACSGRFAAVVRTPWANN